MPSSFNLCICSWQTVDEITDVQSDYLEESLDDSYEDPDYVFNEEKQDSSGSSDTDSDGRCKVRTRKAILSKSQKGNVKKTSDNYCTTVYRSNGTDILDYNTAAEGSISAPNEMVEQSNDSGDVTSSDASIVQTEVEQGKVSGDVSPGGSSSATNNELYIPCPKNIVLLKGNPNGVSVVTFDDGSTKFKCESCERIFKYFSSCIRHKETCRKEYICIKCKIQFKKLTYLKNHVKLVHAEGKWTCQECSLKFRTEFKLKSHMKSHKVEPSECPVCHKTFKSIKVRRSHQSKKHPKKRKYRLGLSGNVLFVQNLMNRTED